MSKNSIPSVASSASTENVATATPAPFNTNVPVSEPDNKSSAVTPEIVYGTFVPEATLNVLNVTVNGDPSFTAETLGVSMYLGPDPGVDPVKSTLVNTPGAGTLTSPVALYKLTTLLSVPSTLLSIRLSVTTSLNSALKEIWVPLIALAFN